MNPLINNTNRPPISFGQLYAKVMQDPAGFLSQLGIPKTITTPQGAVQYLLSTGKVNQLQINQAQQEAQQKVEEINKNRPI